MTDSNLFKRAFTRGLNDQLVREGVLQYPSKLASDQAADYIADHSGMPCPATDGPNLSLKIAGELCDLLKQASDALCKEAGHYDSGLSKTAAAVDHVTAATTSALELMQKVASETEKENTIEQAALHDGGARLELENRSPEYANTGVGGALPGNEGEVGAERPVGEHGDKLATAVHRLRTASALPAGVNAHAPNTLPAAAKHDGGAALDMKNRPVGYAQNRPTATAPAAAQVGTEHKVAFDRTAALVLPYLSDKLSDREKVAHIQAMTYLDPMEQATYLNNMYVAYGADKTASLNYAQEFYKQASAGTDDRVAEALTRAASLIEGR